VKKRDTKDARVNEKARAQKEDADARLQNGELKEERPLAA
jgi:hypothetical protein